MFDAAARLTPRGFVLEYVKRAAELDPATELAEAGRQLGTGLDVAAHDTVPFSLWVVARHPTSYEDALWSATSQLGDRDTTGAIVGGIVVMATGADAIPVLWRAAAEAVPDLLAD